MTSKRRLGLGGTPEWKRQKLMRYESQGYSEITKNTRICLTIGADWTNSIVETPNAQAHNTTQRIPIAPYQSNQTDRVLHM